MPILYHTLPVVNRILLLGEMENLTLAVLRALGERGAAVAVAGSGDGALARLSRHCAAYHRVADAGEAARAVRLFRPDLILPVDVDGARLAHALRPLAAGVPFFPAPSAETLRVMDDKWAFHEFLLAHGLASPRTARLDGPAAAEGLPLPAVIKPPADSGGRGVTVVRDEPSLRERLCGASYPLLAQEYVAGDDVDLSFLADDGRLVAWAVQRRGPGGAIRFVEDERVVDLGRRIAAASAYTGLAHVDMRYDGPAEERVVVIECNPRFWGTFSYSLGLGVDFLGLGMELAAGGRPAPLARSPVGPSPNAHLRHKLSDPLPELRKLGRRLLGRHENRPRTG